MIVARELPCRTTIAGLLSAIVLIAGSPGAALADSPLRLNAAQLDGITAGAVRQTVSAGADAAGLLPMAHTATLSGALGVAVPVPDIDVGGAAGGGGAVACCGPSQTAVTGSTTVPGGFGATGGGTVTSEFAGLSISIGAFGGAGVGP